MAQLVLREAGPESKVEWKVLVWEAQETPGKGREPIKDTLLGQLPQEAQGARFGWETRGNRNGVRYCLRSGGGSRDKYPPVSV